MIYHKDLTQRENQICDLVVRGLSNRDTANQLLLTEKTVKFHLTNIYKKVSVENRKELIVYCLKDSINEYRKTNNQLPQQNPNALTERDFFDILKNIKYKDWDINIRWAAGQPYLQVKFYGICSVSGKRELQSGRKWKLSHHMVKSEVVGTAFKAILTAEEHEVRENFKYKEKSIFGPHYDVDVLASLVTENVTEKREQRREINA